MKLIGQISVCLFLMFSVGLTQEVIITDFPVGVGSSVNDQFFKPFYPQLQTLVDSHNEKPTTNLTITGAADAEVYRRNSDAKNPALALGRAHALRRLLINQFGVDSTRIIVQSTDIHLIGAKYRYASVRLTQDLSAIATRVSALENRPPVEKRIIERIAPAAPVPAPIMPDMIILQVSAGVSSSPYGGIPIMGASIGWEDRIFVEGLLGHTFWNGSYFYEEANIDTQRRLIGGQFIYYPKTDLKVGLVAGWLRTEEISKEFFRYVKISEGLMLGVRTMPFKFLSVTAAYNPSRSRQVDQLKAENKSDQFMISIATHLTFGGGK